MADMIDIAIEDKITSDTLFDGKILCRQLEKGYRFSIDSVLVSHFAKIKQRERILDLGSGCGIIGLVLLHRYMDKGITVTGIEKQEGLANLARKNIKNNKFQDYFKLIQCDVAVVREKIDPESYSLSICNPPFYSIGRGRLNKERGRSEARHQQSTVLDEFVKAASYSLKNKGRAVFIYPAVQLAELITSCTCSRLEPKTMRFVYPYPVPARNANLVLLETVKNGGRGLEIPPPLYIYKSRNGSYSEEVEEMYR